MVVTVGLLVLNHWGEFKDYFSKEIQARVEAIAENWHDFSGQDAD